jgi:hypothetical protein
MVAQIRRPILGCWTSERCHVFGDRRLANVHAEFEEFAMDPGSAPEQIDEAHFSDQLANFERDPWSVGATSRLPSPEQTKPFTLPSDHGRRLRDRQSVHNARRNPSSRSGEFHRSTLS